MVAIKTQGPRTKNKETKAFKSENGCFFVNFTLPRFTMATRRRTVFGQRNHYITLNRVLRRPRTMNDHQTHGACFFIDNRWFSGKAATTHGFLRAEECA